MKDELIGIIGFGTMGSEIALSFALSGYRVVAAEAHLGTLEANRIKVKNLVAGRKNLTDAQKEEVISLCISTLDIRDLCGSTLVIECINEDLAMKRDVFKKAADICGDKTKYASNTSSISIDKLAEFVPNPANFLGLHFFNPATVMTLVEVIPGRHTAPELVEQAKALVESIGKKPVVVKNSPGFIVNRVLIAGVNEAIRLVEEGVSTVEDIDTAMRRGAGHPMGPLKLLDMVGLDVHMHATETIYNDTGWVNYQAPALLKQMVAEGKLGRKTGIGFYDYRSEEQKAGG